MGTMLISCLGSYLLGAVPFGLILSRLMRRQDPRSVGSGNIGATNVFRSIDRGLGVLTLICDVAKGWFPVWLGIRASLPTWAIFSIGLCAFLGHLYPIYLDFRGGKGVSTGAGVFMALVPYATLGSLAAFFFGLAVSGYVSVGSILGAIVLPCLVVVLVGFHPYFALGVICSVGILWKHRDNIGRLREGNEKSWRS